jgi:hypothetical protein
MSQFKLIYISVSTFSKLNFSTSRFFDNQVTASELISSSKFSNVGMTPCRLVNNSHQRLVVSSFKLIVTEILLSTFSG